MTRLKSPVRSVSTRCFSILDAAAASLSWAASLLAFPGFATKQFRTTIIALLLCPSYFRFSSLYNDSVAPLDHAWLDVQSKKLMTTRQSRRPVRQAVSFILLVLLAAG